MQEKTARDLRSLQSANFKIQSHFTTRFTKRKFNDDENDGEDDKLKVTQRKTSITILRGKRLSKNFQIFE